MQVLVVRRPHDIALEERDEPRPACGEVLVRPTLVGVCGTDLDIIDGRIDEAFVRYPIVIGHEWTGVVEVASDDPASPPPGAAVVVEGIVPCGHCAACVAGDTNLCETYSEFGFTRDGAATGLVTAPTRLVHPLIPRVTPESAVLVEPSSVVLRALTRAQPKPGQRVAVVGDGTVALLAARLVRLWSPASVTMFGRRGEQAALAQLAGVDDFRASDDGGSAAFDLVIEAAGSAAATSAALRRPTRGGTVLLLGYPGRDVDVPLRVDDVVNGDVRIIGSFGYTSTAWREVVALLNAGTIDLGFLVTHRFHLADWSAAVETLRGGGGTRAKIVLVADAPAESAAFRPTLPED